MKEIEKISVSGIAFTLEIDALELLNNYLGSLRKYYKDVPGNEEIVADVEERVAELLIERGGKGRVVDNTDIQYIIATLGTPEELADADSQKIPHNDCVGEGKGNVGCIKKRLFRDPKNGVLGGVCSGLARYLDISPIWIRVILVLAVLFGSGVFFGQTLASILIVGYIILWIAMPPARTVAQRCSMDGIDPGLEGIKNYKERKSNDMGHSENRFLDACCRSFRFVLGIVMLFVGIMGLVGGMFLLFGFDIFTGISVYALADYIIPGTNLMLFKIASMGVWFIPCIAFLYAGSKLCFKFKSPKWRPGLILFILWGLSIVVSVFLGISKVRPFINHYEQESCTELNRQYDTVYVKFTQPQLSGRAKMHIKTYRYGEVYLYYVDKSADGCKIAYYPSFEINRKRVHRGNVVDCSRICKPYIELETEHFYGASLADIVFPQDDNETFVIQDSLITVYPKILSKETPFEGKLSKINLKVPSNTVVIMKEPKEFEFFKRMDD